MKKIAALLIGFAISIVAQAHAGGDLQVNGTIGVGPGVGAFASKISQSARTYGALTVSGTSAGYSGINFMNGTTNLAALTVGGNLAGFFNSTDSLWLFYAADTVAYFKGYVWAPGFFQSSDRKLKENIVEVTNVLDKIGDIHAYRYDWKDKDRGTGKQIGFMADEIERNFPELVQEMDDENNVKVKAVSYTSFVPVLMQMVKELNQRNLELEKRIQKLESK